MVRASPITDEDLTAYLDGEADSDRLAVLDAALRDDPETARRLRELSAVSVDDMRAALAPMLTTAPPFPDLAPGAVMSDAEVTPLRRSIRAEQQKTLDAWAPSRRRVLQFAASVACVAAGAGGYAALQTPGVESWSDYAAAYHRLYSADTLAMVMTDEPQQLAQLVTISAALGTEIELAALQQAGMRFVRGQLLSFDDRPVAHLAFMAEDGAPVALCIYPVAGKARTPTAEVRFGVPVLAWSSHAFEAVLLGNAPAEAKVLISAI
ncbi:MAG: twin-arginine translocation signal domain-containing protein [Pseudomonadota bacterium]